MLRIFGPKIEEVTGGWRKPHDELHDLFYSLDIIRMTRSTGITWRTHSKCGRDVTCIEFYLENLMGRDHLEYLDLDERATSKWILGWGRIHVAQKRDQWHSLSVPLKAGNLTISVTSQERLSFMELVIMVILT
jgi:hypothetical protein